MNNSYKAFIVPLFLSILANIALAEECTMLSAQINKIHGLSINAPLKEYTDINLFTEQFKQDKNIPSVKRRFVSPSSNVNSVIYFESTNNVVSHILYKFEKQKFKSISEMSYYVSIMLGLPRKGWEGKNSKMTMKCKDFTVNVDLGNPRRSSIIFPSLVLSGNIP